MPEKKCCAEIPKLWENLPDRILSGGLLLCIGLEQLHGGICVFDTVENHSHGAVTGIFHLGLHLGMAGPPPQLLIHILQDRRCRWRGMAIRFDF